MRRRVFLLLLGATHAAGWIGVLSTNCSLRLGSPATLFGVPVNQDLAIGIALSAGLAVAGSMLLLFLWLLLLACDALARRLDRSTAGRMNLCHRCHYDLTANVSGVCPECGTPVMPVTRKGAA